MYFENYTEQVSEVLEVQEIVQQQILLTQHPCNSADPLTNIRRSFCVTPNTGHKQERMAKPQSHSSWAKTS